MENWVISVLTEASLMPPTEIKETLIFYGVSIFFRTEASLVIKNHPIPLVCRTVWTNNLLV